MRQSLIISAFTVGGGYVIVSVMRSRYVERLGWLTEAEMTDLITLAQTSPGALAVNAAILVGTRLGGMSGAVAGFIGTVIPPFAIMCIISLCYNFFIENRAVAAVMKGMQLGVSAVMIDIAITYAKKTVDAGIIAVAVTLAAFLLMALLDVNIIILIVAGAAVGIAAMFAVKRKKRGGGK